MVKSGFNDTEFTKSMHSCLEMVKLIPDQPNQWLWE